MKYCNIGRALQMKHSTTVGPLGKRNVRYIDVNAQLQYKLQTKDSYSIA